MVKLSDSQLIILSHAAQRSDGAVLPTPRSLKAKPRPVLQRLLRAGFVAEVPATTEAKVWRESEDRRRLMLVLTDAGHEAIDASDESDAGKLPQRRQKARGEARKGTRPAKAPSSVDKPSQAPRNTKQGLLMALLSRPAGASIAEAVEATGWQPHSVRGAISGTLKKKLGLSIATDVEESRGRVYRIVESG